VDLDDVAGAVAAVVGDVAVALDDVEIVVGDVLHVEAPAWVAAGAEGVVDHVADGGNVHGAEAVESAGAHPEELVGPEEVGLFAFGDSEEVAVEVVDGGAGGEAEDDLADEGVGGVVLVGVERDDLMAEALQRPEAVEGRIVGREARGVQNLHSCGESWERFSSGWRGVAR